MNNARAAIPIPKVNYSPNPTKPPTDYWIKTVEEVPNDYSTLETMRECGIPVPISLHSYID